MKDIRASGERVISIITDLNDLSRIETGKIDLSFTSQNLNEMVESCVAVMQPLANRERIIVRTSLAHTLPTVIADARALRQITLSLIGNSIHLANAGGQVIVSTALSDYGDVVMRVRDTGHGLNDNELAAAMEPFRTEPPSDKTTDSAGITDHIAAAAEGFGMPAEWLDGLRGRGLDDGAGRFYVGYADGQPVTSGMGQLTGSTIGIYNIATVPAARRKGYGAAMTQRIIDDAVADGSDVAILQASDMGKPTYERLGFRTVVEYVAYADPATLAGA
jgi:GNAT superfamily N-acetyltransferase